MPTVSDYCAAFREIGITVTRKRLLCAWYDSPDHTATARTLAGAIDSRHHGAATSCYGRLGSRLCEKLKLKPEYPFHALGYDFGRDERNELRIKLHPEVVGALERLGWVRRPPRYFTAYWTEGSSRYQENKRERFTSTGSSEFRRRGVEAGDFLYLFTLRTGQAYLIGRMQVEQVLTRAQAVKHLRSNTLWKVDCWCVASEAKATRQDVKRRVSMDVARRLRFVTESGEKPLAFVGRNRLSGQALRSVRRLTPESARLLDTLFAPEDLPISIAELPLDHVGAELKDGLEDPTRQTRARLYQGPFRDRLLRTCGGRCMISGCGIVSLLEAAHIEPYSTNRSNDLSNGLLLRSDLHTLFDAGLLAIDPSTMGVHISKVARRDGYEKLHGVRVDCAADRLRNSLLRDRWSKRKR